MTDRVDAPPCAGGDPSHVCGSRCLPLLVRRMPPPPPGWVWRTGNPSRRCWLVWLQQVGTVGRWYVVGLSPVDTARELAAVLWAYIQGNQHPTA